MILIADDDRTQLRMIGAMLDRAGRAWRGALSGQEALSTLAGPEGGAVSLALLDVEMPGLDGIQALRRIRRSRPRLPVLIFTAKGSIARAVEATRAGADDFLLKPLSPQRLLAAIDAALQVRGRECAARAGDLAEIVAEAPATRATMRLAERAASSEIPLLIEGESGVGKEVVARAVHAASARAAAPFVAVNCGALPETLVESILFGHEKGAFTGAVERRAGKFLEADGGTLFLDEVGELPPEAQVKLLRALQSREIDPLGAARPRAVDIRVISATNRDLAAEAAAGRFREDLFYRLSVFPIRVPPLRERREDVAPLAERFLGSVAASERRPAAVLSPAARDLLVSADWPGNVRQLENAVYRAAVIADGPLLEPRHFDRLTRRPSPPDPAGAPLAETELRTLAEVEAEHIRFALARCGGRMSETARRLGIGRSTLYRKIEEFGLPRR